VAPPASSAPLALGLAQCQGTLGLLFGQLRTQPAEGGPPGIDRRLLHARIDLDQQLALLDRIAGLHMQVLDLPGHLRADIDETPWLQLADRHHAGSTSPRVTATVSYSGPACPHDQANTPSTAASAGVMPAPHPRLDLPLLTRSPCLLQSRTGQWRGPASLALRTPRAFRLRVRGAPAKM
jgi:hypothetical protein